jgi:hypothetical protein
VDFRRVRGEATRGPGAPGPGTGQRLASASQPQGLFRSVARWDVHFPFRPFSGASTAGQCPAPRGSGWGGWNPPSHPRR